MRSKGKRGFKKWSQSGQERKMSRAEALALRKEENGCYWGSGDGIIGLENESDVAGMREAGCSRDL